VDTHTHPSTAITDFTTAAAAAAPVASVAGRTGAVTLAVADVANAVSDTDARLSDARTPTSHTHGNLTNAGAIGTTSGLPLKTGTDGAVEAGAFGTGAGEFCEGDDARFSDIPDPSAATPQSLGSASAGTSADYSRGDHVHPVAGLPIEYVIACSDETSDLTTGAAKVTFRAPVAFLLTAVASSVNTAPTGSTLIVDINNGANSTLSTKLSIDADEKTSATAASAAVIDTDYDDIAADAEITIDIDQIGSTVAGKGLKVILKGTRA
jgi:hypothetical protein